MAKNCPYCQTELPDDAAFCYGCGKPQAVQQEEAPRRTPRWLPLLILALTILTAVAVWQMSKPTSYLGTYELDYTAADDMTYHLALSFSFDPAAESTESTSVSGGTPVDSCLYVTDAEGSNALPAFAQQVEDVRITALATGGADIAELSESGHDEQVWNCVAYNDSTAGANILRWELEMANGDTLIVSHKIDYTE